MHICEVAIHGLVYSKPELTNLGPALYSGATSGWGKGGNVTSVVTSARCQVTLCDSIWNVSSCSCQACCKLLYPVTYLLIYLLTYL